MVARLFISRRLFLRRKPGYTIIAAGVHDLSVDCMNTSFLFGEELKLRNPQIGIKKNLK